jgi:urease accessory protein
MPDALAGPDMLRLLAWLSPSFPVGSFSYSHGLERAVQDGVVADGQDLAEWLRALLDCGSVWNDALLFGEAWRSGAAGDMPREAAELGVALAGSAERLLETGAQGAAFAAAMDNWGRAVELPDHCPYCVAVGAQAGAAGIPLEPALAAFLMAFASSQLQAAIRLGVIGQAEGVKLLAGLEEPTLAAAAGAARSNIDDIGSVTLTAEIAAMRHETQYSRLFRT